MKVYESNAYDANAKQPESEVDSKYNFDLIIFMY